MERRKVEPREGWPAIIEEQGLIYWKTEMPDGTVRPYWDESAYYSVSTEEVYEFEATARVLMEMLVEAGDHIIERNLFSKMGIPGWAVPRIRETWESEPPMVYGRFDFALAPDGQLKLLEYNADTPTALMETAVQWHWLVDVFGEGADQWNAVHERLVERWTELKPRLPGDTIHFLHSSAEKSGEDFMTVSYLVETARAAGYNCELQPIEQLGLNPAKGFVDMADLPVRTAFKLYPWEWLVREDWHPQMLDRMGHREGETIWIEPIWKMLWSNKGVLPVLWELFEGHDNLVPAYFEADGPELFSGELKSFVKKPLLAREGADSQVWVGGELVERGPEQGYGEEGHVFQQYVDPGVYDGARPVLGVWTVDMEPAGLGIRESDSHITNNLSRFVPHAIEG